MSTEVVVTISSFVHRPEDSISKKSIGQLLNYTVRTRPDRLELPAKIRVGTISVKPYKVVNIQLMVTFSVQLLFVGARKSSAALLLR